MYPTSRSSTPTSTVKLIVRLGVGHKAYPNVVVILQPAPVVVKLDVKSVERDGINDRPEECIGERTLRRASQEVLLASGRVEFAQPGGKRNEVCAVCAAGLNIQVDATRLINTTKMGLEEGRSAPIQYRVPERTRRALATKKEVPHCIRKSARLRRGRECRRACCTSETERDDLALGLARFDVARKEAAVRECGPGEDAVPCSATCLIKRRVNERDREGWRTTHAGEVERRETTGGEEDVQKGQGEDIDAVVLAVVGERLLPFARCTGIGSAVRVLSPIHCNLGKET